MNQIVATTLFLCVVGALVPMLASASRKVFESTEIEIERHPFYAEAILVQLVLLLLAAWAAKANGLVLSIQGTIDRASIATAVGVLGIAVLLFVIGWRTASEIRKIRLLQIVPRSNSERLVWGLVSLTAGVSEELIYRGVLFGLLHTFLGSWWIAALLSAIAFALAHLAQGALSAIAVGVFGIALQFLAAQTGGLLLVILIHFIYDLFAGIAISYSANNGPEIEKD